MKYNYPGDYVAAVQREMREAEMTGMWETLLDAGVPNEVIETAIGRDGFTEEAFRELLEAHTNYKSFEHAGNAVYGNE